MSEAIAAKAHPMDHIREMASLMGRGAHVSISGIPDDPSFLSSHFGPDTAREIAAEMARRDAALLAAERLADAVDEWNANGRTAATSAALNTALGNYRAATGDTQ